MPIDLASEWIAALRSPDAQKALAEALRPIVADELDRVLKANGEHLAPLATIVGSSVRAAAARLRRDNGLRALGIPIGRRLFFRRSEVELYLKQRSCE